MNDKLIRCLVLIFCISVGSVMGQTMKFDKDGMAIINGKRTFMLGLYENPAGESILKQVSEAGFTIIGVSLRDSATTKKNLDRLARFGMGGWISGSFDLSRDTEEGEQKLRTMVQNFGSNPALLAWEVPDEALWNTWSYPWEYRTGREIKLLNNLIDEVKDSTRRVVLRKIIKEISDSYFDAQYAKGEQSADSLWNILGKARTGVVYNISTSSQKAKEMAAGLKFGYDFMKSVDPAHPVLMNHAPRNQIHQLAEFNKAADIVGCDIYPVPEYKVEHSDLADLSLSCVGNYTQRMKQAASGKPVWMVLQGFGWGDLLTHLSTEKRMELRRPTLEETRFMAFDAIVSGARGISYWGTYLVEKDSRFWNELLTVIRELSDLQPVLSAKDAKMKISYSVEETLNSFDRTIKILPKKVGDDIYFIVVNENKNKNPVIYSINGLKSLNGLTYTNIISGKQTTVANGSMHFPISGQTVQVLKPLRP